MFERGEHLELSRVTDECPARRQPERPQSFCAGSDLIGLVDEAHVENANFGRPPLSSLACLIDRANDTSRTGKTGRIVSADEARCRIENLFAVGCEVNNVEPRIRQATSDITNLVVRVCNDQHAHSALDCASHGANQLVGLACPANARTSACAQFAKGPPDLRSSTSRERPRSSAVNSATLSDSLAACSDTQSPMLGDRFG
ncbi:MAG: hypothetical protein E6I52_02390 [Chloroflexi bacterium]|nr:MAG: hypothetical protein E6I52_02390 [Chloroflexota bacterium]